MQEHKQKTQVLRDFMQDRWIAHKALFEHRHHNLTPNYHFQIIKDWASEHAKILTMTFRGGAKSTLAEEAIILGACLHEFHNCIILGETYHRAVERLTAIKNEFERNERLIGLFGELVGPTWTENKIVLGNGCIIQAFGRGQSLRGSKHLDRRPDLAFVDDFENEDSCIDELAISKAKRWFMSVVTPALEPSARMRVAGTPLHPKSVLMQLLQDTDWLTRVVPIESVNEKGERVAAWPDRFPLAWIDKEKNRFHRLGLATEYAQEFMCQAEDISTKPFTADLLLVKPRARSWEATYAFFDPARSVSKTASTTGWAVWSWINNRLIVWDAGASLWKPDEIIQKIFSVEEEFRPVEIGIEKTGLVEFILQPLRQEMLKRGYAIPIRDMNAPRGKHDFIRSLQPFFKAGEVEFAKDMPELAAQLLSFPTGKIDAPNALAYALSMRPGATVYEGFGVNNIAHEIETAHRIPIFLAVNADRRYTGAVLAQVPHGAIHILWDGLLENDPGNALASLVADAGLAARRSIEYVAGPQHFLESDTIGLRAAASRIPIHFRAGGPPSSGRETLREKLQQTVRGLPALRIASQASWTLRALSGGYCLEYNKHGALNDFIKGGPYQIIMEALESFAALLQIGAAEEEDLNYSYTLTGKRYLSALANR